MHQVWERALLFLRKPDRKQVHKDGALYWLFCILRYQSISHLRGKKVYLTPAAEYFAAAYTQDVDSLLLKDVLSFITANYSPIWAELFYLRFIERRKQREIAEELNITMNQINYQISRMQQALRRHFDFPT